ncbi:hypothetical protein, partial [Stigmatella aurantiaca]|uniref:hypothetical protein n=1 Tax=Stigmatella aurantiaca TaxID=41 RepID=UPI00055F286A
ARLQPSFLSAWCQEDFNALASEPLDTSIPGARSVKVVLDQFDNNTLYFQNSTQYAIGLRHVLRGTRCLGARDRAL